MHKQQPLRLTLLSALLASGLACADAETAAASETDEPLSSELEEVTVTAERQAKQQLGYSLISSQDLNRQPITNDVSEIVRTMPGVNFSSNSPSGSRGNKRQIDLRSMGPENTLILIDGKPVTSRNAERYSRNGDRNTRGDSSWVPPDEIESIEVIRGPAAARYGSGAMGGVVNIRTKPVSDSWRASISSYFNLPKDNSEGSSRRVNFGVSGPLIPGVLGMHVYGGMNKTDADALDLNEDINGNWYNAGREGVRNKDIAGRLSWNIAPDHNLSLDASYSRQGNIYNGDTQTSSGGGFTTNNVNTRVITAALAQGNVETARLYRQNYALTYNGKWDWGSNKSYIMYEQTVNSRLPESLFASSEGSYRSLTGFTDSVLKNTRLSSEFYVPFKAAGMDHTATLGLEAARTALDDPSSMSQSMSELNFGMIDGLSDSGRSGKISQNSWAVFAEDNIALNGGSTFLTPGLRYDYSNKSGGNWSPSLNFSHSFNGNWRVKGGIARAYKTPNLYQIQPNYLTASGLRGCPLDENNSIASPTANDAANPTWGRSCYFRGNEHLKPETSVNKEIGVEYRNRGYLLSLAYFHNDYRNKIVAEGQFDGTAYMPNDVLNANVRAENWPDPWNNGWFDRNGDGTLDPSRIYRTTTIYRWGNAKRAVVEGFEGNMTLPLITGRLTWNTNFTYMRRNVNKDTGNPLTIVPRYTVNSTANWQISPAWDANVGFTYYGRQLTKSRPVIWGDVNRLTGESVVRQYQLGSYGIWNASVGYNYKDRLNARLGVTNIGDKTVKRTNGTARTYNERGRAYYLSLKYQFE
ncbi:MAG: FepA family TonB-dependent siderophore receptor [Neisseria sp.]|nr:FepA family TonB-dependent siderophore receptor [Neisseria sp.]